MPKPTLVIYIVEYIEDKTGRWRAVRVQCEDPRWINVELMKQHDVEPVKILKTYQEEPRQ